jgi:glycosyltransferase involved in cell wall biosynthesis
MKTDIKNIALLTSTFFPSIGGVEVGIHNIALRLISKGLKPIVIAPYNSKNFEYIDKLPYEVCSLPPKIFHLFSYLPEFLAKSIYAFVYAHLQKKYNFDVWHITMGYPAGISFVDYGNKNKIPYLVRCAGSDIQVSDRGDYGARRDLKIDKLIKTKLVQIPCLISISNSVYEEYKKLTVTDESIVSITNGVSTNLFDEIQIDKEIYNKYNIPKDYKLFLSVGRNHPKKNFKLLFKVAKGLKERNFIKFIFLIVGDNTDELNKYLTEDIKENILLLDSFGIDFEDGVPIIPHRDLISLYKASDLFVFPSYIETFGIVLIEAMAAGLPIVTTDVEGCRDLVSDGENGYLLDPENSNDFVDKIIQIMNDDDLYKKFAQNNTLKAKQFDWDIIVDKYIETYKKLG